LQTVFSSANMRSLLITGIFAMNVLSTLEKLAATPHYNTDSTELIASLPHHIHSAALAHDHHKLRQLLSGEHCFPDARTVTSLV
jgi:hypothetical protein